jgi:hypothetical protein
MSIQKTMYRDIEILYGCDIVTAVFHAHFDLPAGKHRASGFQRKVRLDMSPRPQPGKDHVQADTEEQVLAHAQAKIDSYLDDES